MVFDLPFFRLEPTDQANPRLDSARNIRRSAATDSALKGKKPTRWNA
jgi:hypothetical protein